jgi:hypothetical protein
MHIKTTAVPKTERELIDLKLFVDDKNSFFSLMIKLLRIII